MTGNILTNGDVIDKALKEGPLPEDELLRRAKIMLYNDLGESHDRNVAILLASSFLHPETRQVMAKTAELINNLAMDLGVVKEENEGEES